MYNIILIITDTYRYDNLGDKCKTMPVRTPELDAFAENQLPLRDFIRVVSRLYRIERILLPEGLDGHSMDGRQ